MPKPHFVPQGLHSVTPQLVATDAKKLVAFLEEGLGAETQHLMPGPGGKGVMHGFVRLGDSAIFVMDAGGFSKATAANTFIYVADVDAIFARATKAGAKVIAPVKDMFWGDRWCMLEDPFGNHWQIATHVEDVSPDEMMKRMKMAQGS